MRSFMYPAGLCSRQHALHRHLPGLLHHLRHLAAQACGSCSCTAQTCHLCASMSTTRHAASAAVLSAAHVVFAGSL